MRTILPVVVIAAMAGICSSLPLQAAGSSGPAADAFVSATFAEAQRLFYSGRYDEAAALALDVRSTNPEDLAAFELRSSALLFQIRRVFGSPADKDKTWKLCAVCQELMSDFVAENTQGRSIARAKVEQDPADDEALFLLGKLNLNYVWLQLGTVGRKTGWSEYWEARKSLDALLNRNPRHVRARVARAWIDYIVDTKLPRGTRWLLGGGNRKRGLLVVQEAAQVEAPPFVRAEARFALWDMQVRERNLSGAVVTARALSTEFPDNRELTKFITTHDLPSSR